MYGKYQRIDGDKIVQEPIKKYKYVARDSKSKRKTGCRQASTLNELLNWLRDQGLTPVSVDEVLAEDKKTKHVVIGQRIKSSELAALCWQLTTMVEGGIPIISAIDTISEDIDNTQLQKLLRQVLEEMQGGEPLSDTLARFPKVFNNLSIAMILAGESSGNLADALRRLAEYFDNRDKFVKKIRGAMTYPVFAICFIIMIVIFIMTFIIPRFTTIFDQLGSDLPGFTKGFMAFYDMIRNNVIYIIGAVLLLFITSILTFRTKKGHYWFCRVLLKLPLIGKVLSQAFVTIFCKTMSTLLSSGVSVLETFDILATMTNNDIIKTAIMQTREKIVEGESISSGLSSSGFFPNMVVKMIQVGEESGAMSNVLDRTANYYERKVDATIDTLMALLEPIMIVVVGAIVLVITVALYLPIFSMG